MTKDIFAAISNVVSRFGQSSYGLPAQKEIVETRKLVGFSVLGDDYVMPLNELSEVLDVPECTSLPRVKSWVRGLANVRGRLLPIIDLADFLGGSLAGSVRDRRVLVLDMDGIYVGLIVDSVQGIKSLPVDHYKEARNNRPMEWMKDRSQEEIDAYRIRAGRVVYGVEMKIVDADNNQLPWDGMASGVLKVKGPWVCKGYYKLDDKPALDEQGWFDTGDMAAIDEYGYVVITDRVKDVIKSGGEWISSIDVENAAMSHPDVQEAAVIGVPDPKWTERPLLIVVPVEGVNPDKNSILESLEGKIAKWWIPQDCVFIDEIPHTATGKISKKDLRDQFKDYQYA